MTEHARASAPGKVVLLGEYAVLDGAAALVAAIGRRAVASVGPLPGAVSEVVTRMPEPASVTVAGRGPTGVALLDAVLAGPESRMPWPAWRIEIDSSAFFDRGIKLGLGSSAAALVALAGAVAAAGSRPEPDLAALVRAHRAFQGGLGSGIDVAAALHGGVLEFRLDPAREPVAGSVRLPKSVGFAGIFAGGSASTPDLVGRYRRWVTACAADAAGMVSDLSAIAARGCAAVEADDGSSFVAAMDDYGRGLDRLGQAIGAAIVTPEHASIGRLAAERGLAYKVSGAGGGDVGLACGLDPDALQSFSRAAERRGFRGVPLVVDAGGLLLEERAG